MGELADRFDTIVRGTPGYGRKVRKSWIRKMAAEPVSIHSYNADTGESAIETVQNVDRIYRQNQRLYNAGDGYTPSRDFKHVAQIPLSEVTRLYEQGIDIFSREDWPRVVAMLDSPEWQKWRTSPGHIGRRVYRKYYAKRGMRLRSDTADPHKRIVIG